MKITSKTKKVIKSMSVLAALAVIFTLCTIGASAAGGAGDAQTVQTYQDVMDIILVWVRRAGAAVGLFGAIILALGFKDNDPDRKTSGIWTMIAGFAVAGIALAVDTFNLFD